MGDIVTQKAAFVLPVVGDSIYVGMRATPPHRGFYGAIGGKIDPYSDQNMLQTSRPEWASTVTAVNNLTTCLGEEFPSEAGIREFCEEAFHGRTYPDGFEPRDITDVIWLGMIRDRDPVRPAVHHDCYFFLARVNRRDFSPNPRELADIMPLVSVPWRQIYPLTQIALAQVAERVAGTKGYNRLINPFIGHLPSRETDMAGAQLCAQRQGTLMSSILN